MRLALPLNQLLSLYVPILQGKALRQKKNNPARVTSDCLSRRAVGDTACVRGTCAGWQGLACVPGVAIAGEWRL